MMLQLNTNRVIQLGWCHPETKKDGTREWIAYDSEGKRIGSFPTEDCALEEIRNVFDSRR